MFGVRMKFTVLQYKETYGSAFQSLLARWTLMELCLKSSQRHVNDTKAIKQAENVI